MNGKLYEMEHVLGGDLHICLPFCEISSMQLSEKKLPSSSSSKCISLKGGKIGSFEMKELIANFVASPHFSCFS